MDLRPGSTVKNGEEDLEIVDYIGQGSFGLVFKARSKDDKLFAIKTISTAYLDDESLRALQNEGALASGIRDANVLTIHFFHDGSLFPELPPYLVADYADSGTLEDLIRGRNELFSREDLMAMFVQLAGGMRAINGKLVHRDVKPDNVLVDDGKLKIADFGLSKVVDAATRSSAHTFKGTNHIMYCAPEAWIGQANTMAMDMYSMGIVFYRLATLQHPYDVDRKREPVGAWRDAHMTQVARDPRTINAAIPFSVAQTILKMMAKRPQDRYSTWDQVLDALGEASGTGTVDAGADHVGPLLEKVLSRKLHEEEALLAEKRKRDDAREIQSRVGFAFEELKRDVMNFIDEFNKKSEFAKLKVVDATAADGNGGEYSFRVVSNQPVKIEWDRPYVLVEASANDASWSIPHDARHLIAAGVLAANSGRGFNVLLLAESDADLYGRWHVLVSRPNPLFNRDPAALDPQAFRSAELGNQLPNIGALHTYQMKLEPWDRKFAAEVIGFIL